MISFTVFSEDPNARRTTIMIDPNRVESCAIGESRIADGSTAKTLAIVMQSGTVHVVYGDMSNYLQIERSISAENSVDDASPEIGIIRGVVSGETLLRFSNGEFEVPGSGN